MICVLAWQLDEERSMEEKRQQHVICGHNSLKRHWIIGNLLLEVLFFLFRVSRHARFTFWYFCYIYFCKCVGVFVGLWGHWRIWCSSGEERAWRFYTLLMPFELWDTCNIVFGHKNLYPLNPLSSPVSVFVLFIFSFYHFYSNINSKKGNTKNKWRISVLLYLMTY